MIRLCLCNPAVPFRAGNRAPERFKLSRLMGAPSGAGELERAGEEGESVSAFMILYLDAGLFSTAESTEVCAVLVAVGVAVPEVESMLLL